MANNYPLYIKVGDDLYYMIGVPTISTWNSEERPKKVKKGVIGFNYQTASLEYWDGESWFTAQMVES